MNPQINLRVSQIQIAERVGDAKRHRAIGARHVQATIRGATSADEDALERLAQLEGRRIPRGRLLVAERNGRVLAAMSAADGEALADPFRPTAALVEQLERRRSRLLGEGGRRGRLSFAALRRSVRSRHA